MACLECTAAQPFRLNNSLRAPDDLLLQLEDGLPLDAETFFQWTEEALTTCGVKRGEKKVGRSSYRAGLATFAASKGVGRAVTAHVGGWLSERSLPNYIQLGDEDVAAAVRAIVAEAERVQ
jgi:hypothetical protein